MMASRHPRMIRSVSTTLAAELDRWRGLCSTEGRKAINRRYKESTGTSDWKVWPEVYREIIIRLWAGAQAEGRRKPEHN